jgi:methylglutaconyl-CoA hydratase
MTDLAQLSITGPIAWLTINRPDSRNALSLDLLDALHARLDQLASDGTPHVLALTGAGRAFCAGMDLKQVLGSPARSEQLLQSLGQLTLKLRALPMVVVGLINGPAIGGGCGLVTVCDLAITHAENKMGFPEVDMGVCPAVVAPWLVRKIGPGKARQVLLSGGLISGQQAHAMGIVTQLVPTDADVPVEGEKLVQRLAQGAPEALRATKKLLNELDGSLDAAIITKAASLSASVLNTPLSQAMLTKKLGA